MVETMTYDAEEMKARVLEETKTSLSGLGKEVATKNVDIHDKPINLWYKEINKEKKITIDLPDQYSTQGRILRCMRWKSATDAVEDKYNIPRWLLLAMMAQEGMGDPTQPNDSGNGTSDWGLWLIHIQAANAAEFWLKTLPRYTTWMRDFKHGEEIIKAKNTYSNDIKQLITVDDRFHPIMWLDCAARFLKNVYNRTEAGKDRWINALRKYSARGLDDYLRPVVKYWVLINQYTWDKLPDFSANTNNEISKMKNAWAVTLDGLQVPLNEVKTASEKLTITIDGKPTTYKQYLQYFAWQTQNYWLNEYTTSHPQQVTSAPEEKMTNLEYLNKSKDGQRNIYKYTLSSTELFSDFNEFLQLAWLYDKFLWKTIKFTDEKWIVLSPVQYPRQKWDIFYIKEKIQ